MKAILKEKEISDSDYRDILDEVYGDVEICGMTFSSGRALEELDPTAFRCGKADHEDTIEDVWECSECGAEFAWESDAEECCPAEAVESEAQ